MRTLSKSEVDVIAYKHELFLNGYESGERADFSDCNLSNLNLVGKMLNGANFEGADLSNCNMDQADIRNCNFQNAILDNVYLHQSDASFANFKNASLVGSRLDSIKLTDANLTGADLSNSDMFAVRAQEANFSHAIMDNSHMTAIMASDANFQNASMRNCDCTAHSDFTNARFTYANISKSAFHNANLTGAELQNTNVHNTDFFMANLSHADVFGTKLEEAYNIDTTNQIDIKNFDVEAYKNNIKDVEPPTTQQARQMPSFQGHYVQHVEKQIDQGKWLNPIAQDTYFAGRDNPLLANNNPLMGGEQVEKPKIVDISNNRDVGEKKESYLGSSSDKPKLMFSKDSMKQEQAARQNNNISVNDNKISNKGPQL